MCVLNVNIFKMLFLLNRHLIGFIIFLGLTIYTAMKLPAVVHMPNLSALPHMSDLQKIPKDLLTALSTSIHHLHVPEVISNAFPEGFNLHLLETLSNCVPESLLSMNRTDQCVIVRYLFILIEIYKDFDIFIG